uniref:Protein kinase domain-containing protein n=1 Tax=Macrostomum lignano TaxID=282301 RepID=A0A1I8JQ38_9PLAT
KLKNALSHDGLCTAIFSRANAARGKMSSRVMAFKAAVARHPADGKAHRAAKDAEIKSNKTSDSIPSSPTKGVKHKKKGRPIQGRSIKSSTDIRVSKSQTETPRSTGISLPPRHRQGKKEHEPAAKQQTPEKQHHQAAKQQTPEKQHHQAASSRLQKSSTSSSKAQTPEKQHHQAAKQKTPKSSTIKQQSSRLPEKHHQTAKPNAFDKNHQGGGGLRFAAADSETTELACLEAASPRWTPHGCGTARGTAGASDAVCSFNEASRGSASSFGCQWQQQKLPAVVLNRRGASFGFSLVGCASPVTGSVASSPARPPRLPAFGSATPSLAPRAASSWPAAARLSCEESGGAGLRKRRQQTGAPHSALAVELAAAGATTTSQTRAAPDRDFEADEEDSDASSSLELSSLYRATEGAQPIRASQQTQAMIIARPSDLVSNEFQPIRAQDNRQPIGQQQSHQSKVAAPKRASSQSEVRRNFSSQSHRQRNIASSQSDLRCRGRSQSEARKGRRKGAGCASRASWQATGACQAASPQSSDFVLAAGQPGRRVQQLRRLLHGCSWRGEGGAGRQRQSDILEAGSPVLSSRLQWHRQRPGGCRAQALLLPRGC